MSELDSTNPLISAEERQMRFIVKAVAISVVTIFTIMGGCSMHGHVYEADNLAAEAKIKAVDAEVSKAKAQVEIEKIKAYENMVNNGANPIAVRCMENGFGNDNDVCLAVGIAIGGKDPNDL